MPQSPPSLNHDTTRNTLRTHPYFDKTPCDKWDVVDFCDKIYKELGYVKYNISNVHNCWRTSIQHLQNSADPKIAGVASKLRVAWVLSSPKNDQQRAKNFIKSITRKRGRRKVANHGPTTIAINQSSIMLNSSQTGTTIVGASIYQDDPDTNCADSEAENDPNTLNATVDSSLDKQDSLAMEVSDTKRLQEILGCLEDSRMTLTNDKKMLLTHGNVYLQDIMLDYARRTGKVKPIHFGILDAEAITTLDLMREDCEQITDCVEESPLPRFPLELLQALEKYEKANSYEHSCQIERTMSHRGDIKWIGDVSCHIVRLLENSGMILDEELSEGVWDCLVYPRFLDEVFCEIPELVLQRKEISLSATRYQPYSYFINEPRYDAIARRRKLSADGSSQSCYELLVLETIRKWEGEVAAKWLNDFDKLVGGLRAMLCHIGELVENDPTVMKKIKVVGILQAASYHVLYWQGHMKKLQYIFASYWKAREIVRCGVRLLEEFLQQNLEQGQKVMNILSPNFL
ncbi:hypothetical protein EYC80_005566 [Monilinia laxa]|uniref:Uncharacterized protein n=1 Tax=Monilinia laxa TaxID=61186 RepID=A0A5N6KEM6_MONLA|nr:hypothetical protein EYC80_005566 [Monilinia laxa]